MYLVVCSWRYEGCAHPSTVERCLFRSREAAEARVEELRAGLALSWYDEVEVVELVVGDD